MRVGLLYPAADPVDPNNWSGTPAGLAQGFTDAGAEIVPIGARLPGGVHQAVAALSRVGGHRGAVADRMPVKHRARTWALGRSLMGAGHLDFVVAMGSEMYDLAAVMDNKTPCLTYDDGTLAQMLDHPESDISQAGFPVRHAQTWIRHQSSSSAAATVCCVSTSWAAESFSSDYGIPRDRIAVVGMGHRPRTGVTAHRDWSVPKFLFVGADWQRKNGSAVLEAFARVRDRIPGATLHIVGNHPPLHVPGVTGYGFISRSDVAGQAKLDSLYATATCFVLPSRFDPSPISYLEAASAGLPVIATSVGGAGELLRNGAVVVDPQDTASIASAMLRLSAGDVAQRMSVASVADAATCSWRDVAGRITDAWAAATIGVSGRTS